MNAPSLVQALLEDDFDLKYDFDAAPIDSYVWLYGTVGGSRKARSMGKHDASAVWNDDVLRTGDTRALKFSYGNSYLHVQVSRARFPNDFDRLFKLLRLPDTDLETVDKFTLEALRTHLPSHVVGRIYELE